MIEYKPQLSPYSYVRIDKVTELIDAQNVLFPMIIEAIKEAKLLKGELTPERIYQVPKEEFQAYRTPVWNKDTGITTYTSKNETEASLVVADNGVILKCKGLNIGSIFTRMTNWVNKERLRLPYCKNTGELLEACIELLQVGKVPFPGMTIFRTKEDKFTIYIPPFTKEEEAPGIEEVSITLRRWLEGISNRHVFLSYCKEAKGFTFVYTLNISEN